MADSYTSTIDFRSSDPSVNPYWDSTWDSSSNGKYITEGSTLDHWPYTTLDNDPFDYAHNITTSLVPAGATITSAELTLTFWDDERDTGSGGRTEEVRLRFGDDGSWHNLNNGNDVDDGNQGPFNVLADLNGRTLDVRVDLCGDQWYYEDIYLTSSTLTGNFTPAAVPIPAAFLIGLLGLGTAGLKLRRFA